jgi:hypothetical protein
MQKDAAIKEILFQCESKLAELPDLSDARLLGFGWDGVEGAAEVAFAEADVDLGSACHQ